MLRRTIDLLIKVLSYIHPPELLSERLPVLEGSDIIRVASTRFLDTVRSI